DDGGFSGGNLERPALAALVEDIKAGKVDCVVVYKVDRLSRSLTDFSRLVEVFEAHKVSFVSVTQQFNTTHSMGRLTLNILLSFAQFEREIIGERIRDKVAAHKRKGKWTGGRPLLGYDVDRSARSPRLVLNAEEADQVREIYAMYLENPSLLDCLRKVAERGWTTKRVQTKVGQVMGGEPFSRSTLYRLLTSRIYLGEVSHKREWFPGEHTAIIDAATFSAVQERLQANGRLGGNDFRNRYNALLKRILRCRRCDAAMTHVFQGQHSRKYRYYTCSSAMRKGRATCPHPSLPAAEIEALVVDELRGFCGRPDVRRAVRAALAHQGSPSDSRLAHLLDDFTAVWAMLEPGERVELVRLAVRQVDFDSSDSSIEVSFHSTDAIVGAREEAA
ncbi:MAG: recombinase family protein, partial [Phycisphaerales bacterium]|nr:recombinase family protein [Phycisphaerales bacterium]